MGMSPLAKRRRYPNGFKPWRRPQKIAARAYPVACKKFQAVSGMEGVCGNCQWLASTHG